MNLFSSLESMRGENLASAILRYLIINSVDVRREVLKKISEHAPVNPIIHSSHFSCYLEEGTETKATEGVHSERGRIDIVIEVDNAVIGIESKFFAAFQKNQPFKYLPALADKAMDLKSLRNVSEFDYFMLVLGPKSSRPRIEKHIKKGGGKDGRYGVLDWDEIIDALQTAAKTSTQDTDYLCRTFVQFLKERLYLFADWEQTSPHLLNQWKPKGTALQKKTIDAIYYAVVPDVDDRYCRNSSGNEYAVNTFGCQQEGRVEYVSYGFVQRGYFSGDESDGKGAEFCVITSSEPNDEELDADFLTRVGGSGWWDGRAVVWSLRLEKMTGDPEQWSKVLSPFYRNIMTAQ